MNSVLELMVMVMSAAGQVWEWGVAWLRGLVSGEMIHDLASGAVYLRDVSGREWLFEGGIWRSVSSDAAGRIKVGMLPVPVDTVTESAGAEAVAKVEQRATARVETATD